MAENEVRILVSTDADLSQVEGLEDLIDKIKSEAEVTVYANVDELQTALSEAESEAERLREELAAIEMGESSADFEEVSTALAETEAEAQRLSDALNSLDGANVAGVSSSFDEVGTSADNATTEVDELQGSMDLLNAQALMSIAGELGNLGSQAEGMAQDMNTAAITVGQLATQTGIAEPQLVSMINNISNATFPNDEAMMYVKSLDQIGVASGNLGKSATDLDKINDAFGLGANTVNSLGQELSVLGVDMNNVSSSFNALAYANANTVGGMENYYTFLKKYDAQFNELGYNVDQASVIIAAATQKFGGGRAALSGLSTALKDANGDTRALEEALGLQAGAISNASALTGQYEGQLQQLADEEAEHKTWLDQLNAAWEDMSLAMSPVLSPLASFMGMIGQAGSWAVSVNGLIQLANHFRELEMVQGLIGKLNNLKTALIGIATSAKSAVLGIASFAKELIVTAAGAIKGAIVSLGQLAKSVLLTGYNALKSAAMWVAEKAALIASTIAEYAAAAAQWALNIAMDANPIGILILAIGALVAILGYLYFNNEQVRGAIDGLGQSFVQLGQWIYSGAIYWLEQLQNTLTGVWDFLTSIGELITGTITVALEGLGQAFMMLGQWIYSGAIYWVEQLQTTLTNLWNYIVTLGGLIPANVNITGNQIIDTVLRVILFIATLPAQLGMILTNALAKALGFKGNFVQTMFSAASNAVSNFASGISGLAGKLKAELDGMISDAMNFAGRIGSIMWEAATNAWQNFLNGLDTHSPGIMQRTLLWEVSEMGRRVPIEGASLVKNLGDLAKDAVTSFGTPEMNVEFGGVNGEFANGSIQRLAESHGTTQEINITINGDIDNEDRLQYFVERIRSEMNWNNRTAGRSV
jgi:hypothetical protein